MINMPYKNMFNGPLNAIFLESFDNFDKGDKYLLQIVLWL
jgi:hypothetical protein